MKQAARRKYHYIYKITRLDVSGRYYIGMHSTDNLEDGYFGSGILLAKSIKKYGKEIHQKEILEYVGTREALKLREKEIVNDELLQDKLCMNLKLGGEGGWDIAKGLKGSAKGNAKMKVLRETNPEWVAAFSASASKGLIRSYANGRKSPGWSKKTQLASSSPQANKKRSTTMKNRLHQVGTSNSQYGTCWIKNDFESKKIMIEDLHNYLEQGYKKGRKQFKSINIG